MATITEKQTRDLIDTFVHFRREGRNVPENEIISDLVTLRKYESVLSAISLHACNGYASSLTETREDKKYQRVKKEVEEIAAKYGFAVRFNGDPRGGAIRFILPSGVSNNWDGETWGIYW
jgi:hypothetical protein